MRAVLADFKKLSPKRRRKNQRIVERAGRPVDRGRRFGGGQENFVQFAEIGDANDTNVDLGPIDGEGEGGRQRRGARILEAAAQGGEMRCGVTELG